jgi:hypothetical protein
MPQIAYTITAHPKRAEYVARMRARLTGQGSGPVLVSMDSEGLGCWGNTRRAWGLGSRAATHQLVMQDDISFCCDFVRVAQWCAQLRPKDPVSFFLPRKVAEEAEAHGLHWAVTRRYLWGQALLMPTQMVDSCLAWIAGREGTDPTWAHHDDVRFAAFFRAAKLCVYVPVPTLVEHIGAQDSLLGNPNSASRLSRHYIGDDACGMSLPLYDLRAQKE